MSLIIFQRFSQDQCSPSNLLKFSVDFEYIYLYLAPLLSLPVYPRWSYNQNEEEYTYDYYCEVERIFIWGRCTYSLQV